MKNSKKWLLALGLSLAACSMPPILGGVVKSANIPDGTYTGSYKDFPNTVEIELVVVEGMITECVVTDTKGVFKDTGAETTIPKRIIEAQSTSVDAVSGATNLSRVIMNAAQKALDSGVSASGQ